MRTTIIAIAVHPDADNPVFGERSTHVSIDDDGAGPFIKLQQFHERTKPGELTLDLDELEEVIQAARRLIRGCPKA
jgi:hypothetical protein